jgi:hypothetical protein
MPLLDDILSKSRADVPLHPRLSNWADRIRQSNQKPKLEVFRPVATFGSSAPEMVLHFCDNGVAPAIETLAWDDELNEGLIKLGVRSSDPANEAKRFALGLRAALRKVERQFGDGYFNAVLYELVTESGLTRHAAIADVIKHAYALQAPRDSRNYNDCREAIAFGIAGRMNDLEDSLAYPPEDARSILTDALSEYLDERFSVSSRRQLGLL